MITQLKTYRLTCERCGMSIVLAGTSQPDLPSGWTRQDEHGCGLTGYTRTLDLCPACDPKLGVNQKALGSFVHVHATWKVGDRVRRRGYVEGTVVSVRTGDTADVRWDDGSCTAYNSDLVRCSSRDETIDACARLIEDEVDRCAEAAEGVDFCPDVRAEWRLLAVNYKILAAKIRVQRMDEEAERMRALGSP